MLHTVLHGLEILLLCGNLWVLGDIGLAQISPHASPILHAGLLNPDN